MSRGATTLLALIGLLAACVATPSPTATSTAASITPIPTPSATASTSASPTPAAQPTATPDPLSLEPPAERDDRQVSVAVTSDVPVDGDGTITVTVGSRADSMIDELVLRWPTALHEVLFPAPFQPSTDRIRDGGPPLVQDWTKWVVGPGERGEPAGTVSLGYGPLPANGTLEITLFVTRRAAGPVSFDLQILAGEALLTGEDGDAAELRVDVP